MRRSRPRAARWNASSRFGPVVPLVPARLSMWQEPHFATNSCLPATRSGCRRRSPAAGSATQRRHGSDERPARELTAHHRRGTLSADADGMVARGQGSGRSSSRPCARGDHAARHALPGVALARAVRRAPRASPRAAPAGASSQRDEPVGELARRLPARARSRASGRAASGTAPASVARDLAPGPSGARRPAARRTRPPRRRPCRTPRGTCSARPCASPGRQQVGELGVLEPPGPARPARAAARGGVEVARPSPRSSEERRAGSPAQPPAALGRAALARRARARREVAGGRARRAAARGPRGRRRSRRSRAARAGTRASTSGHAASSRSTPLETISLPTKTTSRSRRGRASAQRGGGRARRRGRTSRRRRGAARRARERSAQRRQARARRARGSRGANCSTSTPGGPSRVRSRQRPGRPSPPTGSRAVWREPTSTPRAPREPLARVRQEALRVALDGVLQRAAVDLDRVGHVRRPSARARIDRAHHEVVGERDVGPRALGDLAHGGDVARRGSASSSASVQLEERPRLEALVAVGDVDRQQAADVGL